MRRIAALLAAQCAVAIIALAGCGQSAQDGTVANETNVSEMNAAAPLPPAGSGNAASAGANDMAADPKTDAAEPEPLKLPAEPQPDKAAVKVVTPSEKAPTEIVAAVERPASFAMCAVCHSTGKGEPHKIGPNLFGVAGSRAAGKPGYAYSDAMKNSQITWSDAELQNFIANPNARVPGTKMVMAGPKDAATRQAIVNYLSSLK